MSRYTYGALGLVSRLSQAEDSCSADDCAQYYLNDATGTCSGTVCANCSSGDPGVSPAQWTRMDAWGNLIAPIYNVDPDDALHSATLNCNSGTPCSTQPVPLDKPQVVSGPYQYHGCQGYETDVIDPMRGETPPLASQDAPDMGRSTGFIHVGCRYYEPATGRFLEYDPAQRDPFPFLKGQSNRWTYCYNDPINFIDANGNSTIMAWAAFGAEMGLLVGIVLGAMHGDSFDQVIWDGVYGAIAGSLLFGLGAWAFGAGAAGAGAAGGMASAGGLQLWANGNNVTQWCNELVVGTSRFQIIGENWLQGGTEIILKSLQTGKISSVFLDATNGNYYRM